MKKYNPIVLRIFLGSVFLSSGLLKAFDLGSFTNALMNFNYIDRSLINLISVILPFIEIVIGLMLIVGYLIRFVCVSAIILLSIFEVVIFNQLLVDNEVSCGCFGIFYQSQTDVFSLIRNFFLILILYHLAKQNVRCKLCNNLHYLIKLENKYMIKNIIFLSNIHKTTQSEIVNHYINKDIR